MKESSRVVARVAIEGRAHAWDLGSALLAYGGVGGWALAGTHGRIVPDRGPALPIDCCLRGYDAGS